MQKKTNLFVTIMALIGAVCTGVLIFVLVKKYKENSSLSSDFEDEDDFDFAEDFFEEEEAEEEKAEEKPEEEPEEESVSVPKARRGYIPLKFHANEIA